MITYPVCLCITDFIKLNKISRLWRVGCWNLQFMFPFPYKCHLQNVAKNGLVVFELKVIIVNACCTNDCNRWCNMSSEWLQWPKEINDKWALNVIFLWALTWPSPDGWVWRSSVPDQAWRRRGSCGWSSVPSCSRPVPRGNPSCWRQCRPFPAETGCYC